MSLETGGSSQGSTISAKEELSLLGVNLDATLPDMDGNDVDEIFKGVLTDDSQVYFITTIYRDKIYGSLFLLLLVNIFMSDWRRNLIHGTLKKT